VQLTASQEKHVLIATAIVSGMAFADMLAVNTALPAIQKELMMDATSALWVAEIYLLFVASLMLMGGALGDRFGRRKILRVGIYAFAISSLLCAASESGPMLIASRATQGLAAALTMPSSLALLNACFPPDRRGRAIGSWTAMSSMMLPLGPLIGGAAVDFLSWHWIFLINLPLCFAALVYLKRVPKPPYDTPDSRNLDLPGILGLTCGLGALVFGLLEGARHGFDDTAVRVSLIAAVVLLPVTLYVESKVSEPMVPLWMFKSRTFMLVNLQTFFFFAGFQGAMFLLPFLYIQVYGFTAFQAGASGLPITLAMAALSRPVGKFMDRYGAGPLLATAPFVVCGGFFLLAQVPVNGTFIANILPAIALVSLGLALFIAPVTSVALNAIGDGRSGLASAVNNTVARVAALMSVAIMGLFLSSGFSKSLKAELAKSSLNDTQSSEIIAQINRLATIVPPDTLSPAQTSAFRSGVLEAFISGFSNALLFATAVIFVAGAVGFIGLRRENSSPSKH